LLSLTCMLKSIKNGIRKALFTAGIDLTKNQKYDRQTLAIMKKVLKPNSNCIDVGCHKGEVMDEIIKIAPGGKHYGFEPIPEYFEYLKKKYSANSQIHIFKKALSDENGTAEFHWVKNAPAYSGLKQRSYSVKNPEIEKINVELTELDQLGSDFPSISLIKIDVEGAEMKVLKGAKKFIQQHQSTIVFEYGLGAADHYGVDPDDIFLFFNECDYQLNTLEGFLNNETGIAQNEFSRMYESNQEYYFVASPCKA
jgi:FkbM family methyltransferase